MSETTLTHGTNDDCPEVQDGNWDRCYGHTLLEDKKEISDATLALEVHLLAVLLDRFKHLVLIHTPFSELEIEEVRDESAEITPHVALKVKA